MVRLLVRAVVIGVVLLATLIGCQEQMATNLPIPAGQDEASAGVAAYWRGDYEMALRELGPLAEQGYAGAQSKLGFMYDEGKGIPQDYAEAAKWYRKAAIQGDAVAEHNLGFMYDKGNGVPQDYAEAARWYRSAAEQGIADAQLKLGGMYSLGRGVPKDYVRSHMWLNIAASRLPPGDKRNLAVEGRDLSTLHMTPADISKAQRLATEWMEKYRGKKK